MDEDFNLWLIEVNTNPCLEESSKLLKFYLRRMVEDMIKLEIDPIFPNPKKKRKDTINKTKMANKKNKQKSKSKKIKRRLSLNKANFKYNKRCDSKNQLLEGYETDCKKNDNNIDDDRLENNLSFDNRHIEHCLLGDQPDGLKSSNSMFQLRHNIHLEM